MWLLFYLIMYFKVILCFFNDLVNIFSLPCLPFKRGVFQSKALISLRLNRQKQWDQHVQQLFVRKQHGQSKSSCDVRKCEDLIQSI